MLGARSATVAVPGCGELSLTVASESPQHAEDWPQAGSLSPHVARLAENPLVRYMWGGLGTLSVAMGIIGVVLPGWPTTIFLIIAAACYARSSQRMYDRILNNRAFGPHVRRFRETGTMPFRAKVFALGMMWPFAAFAVLFAIPDDLLWAKAVTLLLVVAGSIYVLWLPTDRSPDAA